ncbi:MAG: hypothetical protein IH899_05240 [Planctomycetes bacterium]|nr:hypothetical protein [Planctomycetota bacterium]
MNDRQTLEVLVSHFGTERILAALPQRHVTKLLDLVSVRELADDLSLNYHTFRSHMNEGRIPFPTVRLVRRAYFTREQAETIKQEWNKK